MSLRIKFIFVFFYIVCFNNFAQIDYYGSTDTIIVIANKSGTNLNDLSRSVGILSFEKITARPGMDYADKLGNVAGVDLRTRGGAGIQHDLQIRGGSFEQSLPLINGVKISDPQTGHHNLNLPISIFDITKVEILRGHGSRTLGPNAFTGAINFSVRPRKNATAIIGSSGGSFGSFENYVSLSLPYKNFSQAISASRAKSDGYIYNTSYEKYNLSYVSEFASENANVVIFAGHNYKSFGANGFYSSRFPNQRENIKTSVIAATADIGGNTFSVTPKISYRKGEDEFMLNYQNPSFYRNLHKTDAINSELGIIQRFDFGSVYLGGEFSYDKINSNNLGKRSRQKYGFSGEFAFKYLDFNVSSGLFAHKYSNIEWTLSPGIDVAYNVNDNLKIFSSLGRSFRIPTYTELYYSDPVNQGNPELIPEKAWSGEIGFELKSSFGKAVGSAFLRKGFDIIDWTRNSTSEVWKATNISNIDAIGFEFELATSKFSAFEYEINFNFGYAFCELDKKTPATYSKYSLENLKHQAILETYVEITRNLNFVLIEKYEKRNKVDEFFLTDVKLSYSYWIFKASASILNVFDVKYRDFASIVQPGRAFNFGLELKFENF